MRICFLEGDMSRKGGTERMTALLANRLSEHHQVWVVSLRLQSDGIFFQLNNAVQHQVLTPVHGRVGMLKQISEIRRILCANQIQRVINVDVGMGIFGILAAKGTGAKVITWEHANFFNNWGSRIFPYLRRFAAKHSDAVVVLTQRDKTNYETHISRCAPVRVIPNPVESHTFHYSADSKIILSAGLLLPIKGFDRVIEIAGRILPSRPGWTWVICGEGPERKKLEQLIAEAGLQGRVLLPGSIRDMDEQYQKAAMFVMTSNMEGLPMVLLEAKSWGLPIVSFDIMTGPSDIVTDGVNGYLIAPSDITAISKKTAALMDDVSLRRYFSEQSQLKIGQFSFQSIVTKWEELLR